MLFFLCVLAGVLLSVGICLGTSAFLSLQWLWMLPCLFVAGFFGAMLLAAAFLAVMCAIVPMDVLPEEDSKFYRRMAHMYIKGLKTILRLKIITKGMEKVPTDGRFLLVSNHISDLDPVVLLHCFEKSQLAFISKRENDKKPFVGQVMRKILCQPINRENDREALKTILRCVQLIKDDKVSIAVFPEGYTSLDGKLRYFRNGVFKIAQKANVPVVVCAVHHTREAMKRLMRLKSSCVEIHLIDVIPAQEVKALSTAELGEKVYGMMAEDLGPENVYDYSKEA